MIAAISLTMRKRQDVKYNDPAAALKVRARDRVRLIDMPSHVAVNDKSGDQA
jgi:NADH-quinone oxidoreductase subunit J